MSIECDHLLTRNGLERGPPPAPGFCHSETQLHTGALLHQAGAHRTSVWLGRAVPQASRCCQLQAGTSQTNLTHHREVRL